MKKYFSIIICVVVLLLSVVQANNMNSLDIDIFIEENGDAKVTETWDYTSNQNTELYHSYKNLGKSKIKNLVVSDDSGKTYTFIDKWNIKASFEGKAYKCGIHKKFNTVEICWGISEYGTRKYKVQYEITNFVVNLKDAQMIYWGLVPANREGTYPKVNITISGSQHFEDTVKVWGYGNRGGLCDVVDGIIKMEQPNNGLARGEYMTILVKLLPDTFKAKTKINKSFDHYLKRANKGTNGSIVSPDIGLIIGAVMTYGAGGAFLIVFLLFIIQTSINGTIFIPRGYENFRSKKYYYRDMPCDSLFELYYIANKFGLLKNKKDIVGAIILKWIKNKIVLIDNEEYDSSQGKKIILQLNSEYCDETKFEDSIEASLYKYLFEASGDGALEKGELKKWAKINFKSFMGIFYRIIAREEVNFLSPSNMDVVNRRFIIPVEIKTYKKETMQEVKNVFGFFNYLRDYSLIHKKEMIEVELFEDYLIIAQIFGISKKVIKQFKTINPDMAAYSTYRSFKNISSILTNSDFIVRVSSFENTKENVSNGLRSFAKEVGRGFSGSSSGGGGGGSFGGGGSMGSR